MSDFRVVVSRLQRVGAGRRGLVARQAGSAASVVVQANCSEASRVGDGTRREAAVTARRDSWRVFPVHRSRDSYGPWAIWGELGAEGRGEGILRT